MTALRSFGLAFVVAACASCGKTSSDAPPPVPNLGTASIGPIDVAGGDEETVCILKRLDNAEDILATSFTADLAPGSHHLIVYRSSETDENLDPFPCVPFLGLTDQSEVPLMLVNKLHLEYEFPPNVGIALPAGQMLKIEAHYINTTAAHIQGQGTIKIQGLPASQATGYEQADFAFWGTTHIDIPARSSGSTPVKFQQGIAGTKVFAVTTHQHELGTDVKMWFEAAPQVAAGSNTSGVDDAGAADGASGSSPPSGDAGGPLLPTPPDSALILDETDWSNPQLKAFDPPIAFDGTNGFAYQCTWNNTTDQEVQFGESALNEMCFVGGYYYPSHGFDICIDGHCKVKQRN